MSRIEELLSLNDEQKLILSAKTRIAIEAGAGSGKTRSLVAKYLHILENGEASVEQIVAITFTNNAARELRNKIAEKILSYIENFGERNNISRVSLRRLSAAPIGTIHGFCSRILRENAYDSMISPRFSILEDKDKDEFYNRHLKDFILKGITGENGSIAELLEYEDYDYSELTEIVKYILAKSSLLHLEPPLPVYRPEREAQKPESIHTEIPERLLDDLFSALPGQSRKKAERIRKHADKIKNSAGISGIMRNLIYIQNEIQKSYKNSEETEKARKELFDYIDVGVNRFNHYLTGLYMDIAKDAYEYIQTKKFESQIMDFEDQIRYSYKLLKDNEELLRQYRERFRYIIVDEFQDTDSLQFELLSLLSAGSGNRLVVVGDKKQSIYSFRGGEPAIMESVLKSTDYYSYTLKSNYRSTEPLINYFNSFFTSVFSGSYEEMVYMGGNESRGPDIEIIVARNNKGNDSRSEEIDTVCSKVAELINSENYRDIALLFRNSTHASEYERELRQRNIGFSSDFGYGYYRAPEVRDIVCMLKYITNPEDRLARTSLLRSTFLGASDGSLLKYVSGEFSDDDHDVLNIRDFLNYVDGKREVLKNTGPLSVINHIMHDMGYCASLVALPEGCNKLLNIWKFYNICEGLAGRGYGIADIIKHFDDSRDSATETQPFIEESEKALVKLTTVHRSKGLEFDAVLLCDTNYQANKNTTRVAGDGEKGFFVRFGSSKCRSWKELEEIQNAKETEDEKRLLYVAKTRARKKLVLALREDPRKKKQYNEGSFAGLIHDELNIPEDDEAGDIHYNGFTIHGYTGSCVPVSESRKLTKTTRGFHIDGKHLNKLYAERSPEASATAGTPVFAKRGVDVRDPVSVGEIMHKFLEVWDYDPKSVDRTAEYVLNCYFYTNNDFKNRLAELAENFKNSGIYSLVKQSVRVHREYGFVLEYNGRVERGRIDLLVETESGTVLVDYKYRQSDDIQQFNEQIELYSTAVERKYGSPPEERYIVLLPEFKLLPV